MTPTTKEILERFQVRKSKKQKEAFFRWVKPLLEQAGWKVTLEVGSFGVQNIVIGDVQKAKIVYSAHYDTCARLPFPNFITPRAPVLYFLYQVVLSLLLVIPMFVLAFLGGFLLGMINENWITIGSFIGAYSLLLLMFFGPANPHTANDNTSGVTAILDLALNMPPEQREKAAFVLFDLEEMGLLGSRAFANRHPLAMRGKLLVNLDCVSDGETMLFCFKKAAANEMDRFRTAFPADHRITPEFASKGYIYPSDQKHFDRGIGVASLKRTKGGLLYMNRIHTKRDTVYREENIAWLVEGCIRLTERT